MLQSSDVQVLMQRMDTLETKFENIRVREKNYRSLTPRSAEQDLVPLKAEKGQNLGRAPPSGVFPNDEMDLFNLSHAQLDALASFYEEDAWGANNSTPVTQRKKLFERFIT